jgi:hypothetical protein
VGALAVSAASEQTGPASGRTIAELKGLSNEAIMPGAERWLGLAAGQ